MRNAYFYPKYVIDKAIKFRLMGKTYSEINKILLNEFPLPRKVPKGTFSSWFTKRNIRLTVIQEDRISNIRKSNILQFQKLGAQAVHQKKLDSFENASLYAKHTIQEILQHPQHELLFLSGLYLGEGGKEKRDGFFIGNSSVPLLKTVIFLMRKNFRIRFEKLRFQLHLRADQDEKNEIEFWSQSLQISPQQFMKTQKDIRTVGKSTWTGYHGVCAISYGNVTIHRFLLALQNEYMSYTNQQY